jgi:DMSO reductase anchor subunit
MKYFWLLLLFCLATGQASAQGTGAVVPVFDESVVEIVKRSILPAFALFLLVFFVLTAIKLVLNYLLKRQIVATGTSESIVERLLPGPRDEQNKTVKWVALLLSIGTGLALCSHYLPWEPHVLLLLHAAIILLFSTALGFLAYYLFLRRQGK